MTLREAKQAVRAYIRTWSTQRVAEVYAFNQDGKMSFVDHCGCLLGVSKAVSLHFKRKATDKCPEFVNHYGKALNEDGGFRAENGYLYLGDERSVNNEEIRKRRLSAILLAELRLRARAESQKAERVELVEA